MSLPRVVAVVPGSPADLAGLEIGDEIATINGVAPRDVIEYRLLADEPDPQVELRRGGLDYEIRVPKESGAALGVEVASAVFDRVRTCDNHCEFCFIYQLPPNLRKSLYVKDDDYRLSFLYGNFTTLTRFTEADLERVVTEGLGPLHVSIHSTDPELRARMLRNRRGASSLRWLRALLDHGVEVHGQVVVCPGVNDGPALDETLAGVMDRFPELASVAAVPLGVSRYSKEAALRPHTAEEAASVLDTIDTWQDAFLTGLDRRMIFAADEYYLLADRPFPGVEEYEDFVQHENGVGMARAFVADLNGQPRSRDGEHAAGFFASVDGAPAEGYRARKLIPVMSGDGGEAESSDRSAPATILTGEYGARVVDEGLRVLGRSDVSVRAVANRFFGGNIAVAGLLAGADVASAMEDVGEGERILIPDSCLSNGLFLDGAGLDALPRKVEVVEADGFGLRRALGMAA